MRADSAGGINTMADGSRTASANMRSSTVVLFAGLCVALACGLAVPTIKPSKVADKEFLANQARIFELLQNVHQQDGILVHLHELADKFVFAEYYEKFNNVEVVKEFVHLYETHQLIDREEIFAYHNAEHLQQAIALFKVFYYAKDFEMFYKTLVWARFHVNPAIFVYALTLAVVHQPYLAGYEVPAPYEIFPHFYFGSETIQMAQNMKMQGFTGLKKIENVYTRVIPANYTDMFYSMNEEQKLAYFTEDVGLNAFYYYHHIDYPHWMDGEEFGLNKDRRGEFYLYWHQQLLARFYMERLSNGLGEIPEFSFYKPIKTGYYPSLRYYNGQFFPQRENDYPIFTEHNYHIVEEIEDYERRIRDAISVGFFLLPNGTHFDLTKPESIEQLGNLIQGNADSLNKKFYGYFFILAKTLLGGGSFDHFHFEHRYAPTVLEQFETALRDPMFYQLYKRVIRWYWEFKDQLPAYERKEIDFAGVEIEKVDIDTLETYMDKFVADITNAVNMEPFDFKNYKSASDFQKFGKIGHYNGEELLLKARQTRLNHMPFSFHLTVQSDKAVPAVVRVFMAPKYDEFGHKIELTENRENFYLLDKYKIDLVVGKNELVRNSNDYTWYVKDRTTYYELYRWVMSASKDEINYTLDMSEAHNGVPHRLLLPKGKKGGMPFQFFFIVSPYHAPAIEQFTGFDSVISSGVGSGAKYLDSLPFGYPFDRKIDVHAWHTKNMYFEDVMVFHKTHTSINAVPK